MGRAGGGAVIRSACGFRSGRLRAYDRALNELRCGHKISHWMWFVFPQLAGLGRSATSRRYAICSLDEARAHLAHPIPGGRLRECAAVLAVAHQGADAILGRVDVQKLQSSMTVFLRAVPGEAVFADVLQRHYGGRPDAATDGLLS